MAILGDYVGTLLEFEGERYPSFQATGNAARFILPFAKEFCTGKGVDVGCSKKEWAYPGSLPVDIEFDDPYHALNLPEGLDYIFSSHCLEHVDDWVEVMDYWISRLKEKGTLFLYLPHYSQRYWRPWNNRKHKHVLTAKIITDYLDSKNFEQVFSTGKDLNNSFAVVGIK